MGVVREVYPEKKGAFENISISARTVIRRIEKLSEDVKEALKDSVLCCAGGNCWCHRYRTIRNICSGIK